MIFSITSWSTCIESKAAVKGDSWTFSGTWYSSYFDCRYETVYSEYHIDYKTENNVNAGFWVPGHTYNISGSVGCFMTSTSTSFDSTRSFCNAYFSSGDSETFICGSKDGYYSAFSIDFYYSGQNVGINLHMSLTPTLGNTTAFIGRGGFYPKDDTSITITDLGVVSRDSDILKQIDKSTQHTEEIMGEVNETSKGIFGAIKDFFGSFFQNLIDSVIGLFVPSSDEMSDLFGQLDDFFSDTFGFLYAPFDYLIQLVGVFTSSTGTTGLTLPGFSIMGYEVWGEQTYDLASDPLVGQILEYVRIVTGTVLAVWFIMYLHEFFMLNFGKD